MNLREDQAQKSLIIFVPDYLSSGLLLKIINTKIDRKIILPLDVLRMEMRLLL